MGEEIGGREIKEKHLSDLLETMKNFNKSSTGLSQEMIKLAKSMKKLTWVIAVLTAILTFFTIYQVFIC
jgi:hypothetical protein